MQQASHGWDGASLLIWVLCGPWRERLKTGAARACLAAAGLAVACATPRQAGQHGSVAGRPCSPPSVVSGPGAADSPDLFRCADLAFREGCTGSALFDVKLSPEAALTGVAFSRGTSGPLRTCIGTLLNAAKYVGATCDGRPSAGVLEGALEWDERGARGRLGDLTGVLPLLRTECSGEAR